MYPITPRARKVFADAEQVAIDMGTPYVGCEHLLIGLIRSELGVAAYLLKNHGITEEKVYELLGYKSLKRP